MIKIGRTKYKLQRIDAFKGRAITGQINYEDKTITIARRGGITGWKIPKTNQDQVLWHEVVHGILHDMKHPLNKNEKFVDGFAKRLRLLNLSGRAFAYRA